MVASCVAAAEQLAASRFLLVPSSCKRAIISSLAFYLFLTVPLQG